MEGFTKYSTRYSIDRNSRAEVSARPKATGPAGRWNCDVLGLDIPIMDDMNSICENFPIARSLLKDRLGLGDYIEFKLRFEL